MLPPQSGVLYYRWLHSGGGPCCPPVYRDAPGLVKAATEMALMAQDPNPPDSQSLTARGAKPACAARRIPELAFGPFDRFIAGDNQLGDSVPLLDCIRCPPEIEHDHSDFAAVAGIDSAEIYGERMLQGHAAARANLRFIARRQLNRDSGRDPLRDAWLENDALDRAQIEPRIFGRTMSIGR